MNLILIINNNFKKRSNNTYSFITHCSTNEKAFKIDLRQSNSEADLIDWIHEARSAGAGIVINPAAYSHTSIAIMDALMAFEGPVIEVHVSNIHNREEFRHQSYVSLRADGVLAGLGVRGYEFAVMKIFIFVSCTTYKHNLIVFVWSCRRHRLK